MSGSSAGDHGHESAEEAVEDETIRDAGAEMPGMRGALTPGSLTHASVDPNLVQGDEHRDAPEQPPTPPQPGDSPRIRSVRDPVKPS